MKVAIVFISAILFFTVSLCAQPAMSDREWDWLKGKVQKVVTEHAMLKNESGNWVEGKRELDAIITYDAEGNRMRNENYYEGKLTEISDYSFIDGNRVVKVETVSSPYGGGTGNTQPSNKAKPADSRYTYKFSYKYDKEKRTEEAWYRNDGSLFQRFVRVYDGKSNKVELSRFLADGKTPFRSIMTLNDKGNIIEETWIRPGIADTKWSYNYEFDSNGNWIKRTRMRWVNKDGKSYFEPYDVYYRTITYF